MSNYLWTKKGIRSVIELWKTQNVLEIAKGLGIEGRQVTYMIQQLRKAGVDMPKKWKKNVVQYLIKEVIKEGI